MIWGTNPTSYLKRATVERSRQIFHFRFFFSISQGEEWVEEAQYRDWEHLNTSLEIDEETTSQPTEVTDSIPENAREIQTDQPQQPSTLIDETQQEDVEDEEEGEEEPVVVKPSVKGDRSKKRPLSRGES